MGGLKSGAQAVREPLHDKTPSRARPHQQMAPTIPTGSYLLRNQTTGLVVQYNGQGKFELAERDEILHREQQTFWVEPLPEYQFSSSGDVAYTLSQIGMGTVETQVMEIYQGSCDRMAPIGRYRMHGHLTALWKFIRLEDRKDGCVSNAIWSGVGEEVRRGGEDHC